MRCVMTKLQAVHKVPARYQPFLEYLKHVLCLDEGADRVGAFARISYGVVLTDSERPELRGLQKHY